MRKALLYTRFCSDGYAALSHIRGRYEVLHGQILAAATYEVLKQLKNVTSGAHKKSHFVRKRVIMSSIDICKKWFWQIWSHTRFCTENDERLLRTSALFIGTCTIYIHFSIMTRLKVSLCSRFDRNRPISTIWLSVRPWFQYYAAVARSLCDS